MILKHNISGIIVTENDEIIVMDHVLSPLYRNMMKI